VTKHEINCEKALQQIFQFIDHELGGGEREAMQRHLHTCKSCFSRAEFERRLKGEVGGLREKQEVPKLRRRISRLLKTF
jgi:anti-sigma factor (TIGR02949 family)